jgi:hypothetical protein
VQLGLVLRNLSHRLSAPAMTLILSNQDVVQLLTMRECIDVLENAPTTSGMWGMLQYDRETLFWSGFRS